ncbi:MAG: hypothetical protein RLP02_03850 [Coleofasciculus sp. C2-GNP5-27]
MLTSLTSFAILYPNVVEIYNNGVELTSSTPALRGTPGSNHYSSWGRSLWSASIPAVF